MPGMSIHVVDVSRGVVAEGMQVEVFYLGIDGATRAHIASGSISGHGTLESGHLAARQEPGFYEARFHVARYYRDVDAPLPPVPFLDVVAYRFGISDSEQHYHLPFKCTPWGYSCFRGGA